MEPFSKATPQERHNYLLMRYQSLKNIRAPYLRIWSELVKYIVPYSGCFTPSDKMGYRTQRYIFDPKAERCLDALVGGLSTYATPASLPWFRLVGGSEEYKYDHDAQTWLNQVQTIILDVLRKSNT